MVLSDRAWPGRRVNLDHVVIAPSGVFVIDTKAYGGRVELVDRGSFAVRRGLHVQTLRARPVKVRRQPVPEGRRRRP